MKLNCNRMFQLFRYLPFRLAIRIFVHEACRAMFDQSGRHTYSQSGEDVLLSAYLDLTKPGWYVDVGCHHPENLSNTFSLYARGWRGLAIDGNRDLIELFKQHRPRDIAVCAVVSDVERPVSFAIATRPELSTVSSKYEKSRIGKSGIRERVSMQARSLQRIMSDNQCPRSYDLLTIDCEGHDYEVLRSFDIDYYRPKIVVIEIHNFDLEECTSSPIYRYLKNKGYRMVCYNMLNGIFVDEKTANNQK